MFSLANTRFFFGWATGTVASVLGTHDPGGSVVGVQFDTINDPTETEFFIVRDDTASFTRTPTDVGVQQADGDATPVPFWYLIEMVQNAAFEIVEVYMSHPGRAKSLVGTAEWFEGSSGLDKVQTGVVIGVRSQNATAGHTALLSVPWVIHDEIGMTYMGAPPIPMADTFVPTNKLPRAAPPSVSA